MKNKFLLEMQSRGYLNQCTDLDKLEEICNKKIDITSYIGFDCTAKSACGQFTTNNDSKVNAKAWSPTYSSIRWGTTMIGDPSGKDATRKILDQEEIKNNIKSIKRVFNKILSSSDKRLLQF